VNVVEQYQRYVNTSFVKSIEPIVVHHSTGAQLIDMEDREYIDCFAGISVVNAGHGNPRVAAAAKQQIDLLIHAASYVYYVPAVGELAQRLAEITPGALQKTFFCNSGAEAIETGLRLAKIATGRREIIALTMSFHGRTHAALSITGNMTRRARGGPYMGVAFAPAPNCYRCPLRLKPESCGLACADVVEDVIRYQTSGDVAAFVVEPVLGEGGIIPLPDGYLERVQQILRHYGILLFADEVQTGFGRTGEWFGVNHHSVEPDLMAMAKGIADGFPLGALIAPAETADAFLPGEHLTTFGGNPVSCAAASASINVIRDEGLVERSAALGTWAKEFLSTRTKDLNLVGDIRGRGLMLGIELVRGRDNKEPATREAVDVRALCREGGVLIGVGGQDGNVLRVQPPLVITEEQLSHALSVLVDAVEMVETGA
jgi:4-aminobutyrate aminotransferase